MAVAGLVEISSVHFAHGTGCQPGSLPPTDDELAALDDDDATEDAVATVAEPPPAPARAAPEPEHPTALTVTRAAAATYLANPVTRPVFTATPPVPAAVPEAVTHMTGDRRVVRELRERDRETLWTNASPGVGLNPTVTLPSQRSGGAIIREVLFLAPDVHDQSPVVGSCANAATKDRPNGPSEVRGRCEGEPRRRRGRRATRWVYCPSAHAAGSVATVSSTASAGCHRRRRTVDCEKK